MKAPIRKKVAIRATAAMFAGAAAFVGGWEGLYLKPYRDLVGVVTVCYGETEGVKMTDAPRTPQQCRDMLAAKLPRYYGEIAVCWGQEVEDALSDEERIAYVSGAYNFGSGGFCRSSMVARLKVGDRAGACHALRLYNRAGGKVVRGLDNRRRAEEKLCLQGARRS